jgi:hypothetical protein
MSAQIIDFPKGGNFRGGLRVVVDEQLVQRLVTVIQEAMDSNGGRWLTDQQFEDLILQHKK